MIELQMFAYMNVDFSNMLFFAALDQFGDTILFTTDDEILEAMAQFDDTFGGDMDVGGPGMDEEELQRPQTADGEGEERPFTRAGFRQNSPLVCVCVKKAMKKKPHERFNFVGCVLCQMRADQNPAEESCADTTEEISGIHTGSSKYQ